MIFRELKSGYQINFLKKEIPMKVGKGKVINVGIPQIDRQHLNSTQMVIDITIEIDGKTRTYTVPDSQSIAYSPDIIISLDTEGLKRELEAMKNQAEDALSKTDYYKSLKDNSSEILAELDPAEKEKRETDARMSNIENQLSSITEKLTEFMKSINKSKI